jgi:large subunit ribosomal protein L6
MSRVGANPIPLPEGVEVNIEGSKVRVRGSRGELSRRFPSDMLITLNQRALTVSRPTENRKHRSLHGLSRTLLANMVEGVGKGFEKKLELVGVGYRVRKEGDKLVLQVGYSHPVEFTPPPSVSLAVEGTSRIRVMGIDKELVGQVAASIRALRSPEHYKGKGIRYQGELVRLKTGKRGKK